MPTTYSLQAEPLGTVSDTGPGYLLVMDWHDAPNLGGYLGADTYAADFTPGTLPVGRTLNLVNPTNAHREFHYRFIVVPNPLLLNNPPIDIDIPFRLWNTFPSPDTAIAASVVGSAFVTSDFTLGTSILDFEWKEYSIQIQEGANVIDADVIGVFSQGGFTLDIFGTVTLVVETGPEGAIGETWKWNTEVITAWDSTEQRIQYMPHPIRSYQGEYKLDTPEILSLQKQLFSALNGQLSVPKWHLECFTTGVTLAPSNVIFFDRANTSVNDGDQLYIVDPQGNVPPLIVTIAALTASGATLTSGAPQDIGVGWSIYPLESVYFDSPQIRINTVTGSFSLRGEYADRNRAATREGATATLVTHNGLPVLDFDSLADVEEQYQNLYDEIGSSFGQRARENIWPAPRILRSASFRVNRKGNMLTGYEKACVFFDQIAGQMKPFYFSSRLPDLTLNATPSPAGTSIEVTDSDYATTYFPSAVYQSLEFVYADNTRGRYLVTATAPNVDGSITLTLGSTLPTDILTNPITRISFLYRVRLASDTVNIRHQNNRSIFSFSIMGTTQ